MPLRSAALHRLKQVSAVLLVVAAACSRSTNVVPVTTPTASPLPTLAPSPVAAWPEPSKTLSLAAIQRLDPRIGYVAGWTGTGLGLARTTDGGATWQRIAVPASRLSTLRFIDEGVGWVAGFALRDVPQIGCAQAAPIGSSPCRGVVLRTDDGGRTWQEAISIPTDGVKGEPIQQLQAVDGQRAWVLIGECTFVCPTELRRTTDGGRTWTTLLTGGIRAIRFASASRGWLATDDGAGTVTVRVTSDGGTTWRDAFSTASGQTVGLDAATTQTAWLLTNAGYCTASTCLKFDLFRTVDGGVSWLSLGNPKDFACSGGHLHGPLFASVARGWLALDLGAGGVNVGPGGLLKSEDGGTTWSCTNTPPNTNLVSAADPLHVWVTSDDRIAQATALYSSDNGGKDWRPLDLSSLR